MTKAEISNLQQQLNSAGYGPIHVDGVYGKVTAEAYERYVTDSNVGPVGTPMPVPPASKPWWLSKAVLGSVAGVITGFAGLLGWSIDSGQTTELLTSIVSISFAFMAWWGSVNRTAPIDKSLVLPNVRVANGRLHKDTELSAPPVELSSGSGDFPTGPFFYND